MQDEANKRAVALFSASGTAGCMPVTPLAPGLASASQSLRLTAEPDSLLFANTGAASMGGVR